MPKLKTNKAVKKRFKVTKSGKVLGSKSLRRHMLTDRSSKKKRQNRKPFALTDTEQKRMRAMLPYGS